MSTIAKTEAHAGDGDQRDHGEHSAPRYEEGQPQSHGVHDPTDTRSINNRAAAEKKAEKEEDKDENKLRPTQIAESHGNKPSRGAKIDEMLEREEEEELKRKGK